MSLQDGRKVIAFDFDGVLHVYHGWNGGKLNGPMPGMLDVVKAVIAAGAVYVVHTTRDEDTVIPWLSEHGFPDPYAGPFDTGVYNRKWSRIDVFVDDRAFRFAPFRASTPTEREAFVHDLMTFEPHWRRARDE